MSWNLSWTIQSIRRFRNVIGNSEFDGKVMMNAKIPGIPGILLNMSKRYICICATPVFISIFRYLIRYHRTRNGKQNRSFRNQKRNNRSKHLSYERKQRNSDGRHKAFFYFFPWTSILDLVWSFSLGNGFTQSHSTARM